MVSSVEPSHTALDQADLHDACELLRALGTPHRLAIVLELAEAPRCVHELVDVLGISQSLASQHLRVLRSTGLVTGSRRGKETVYALADDHVAHIARDALTHGGESAHRSRPLPDPTPEEHQP
jgi:ArsR family transcriptional regulator, zinc-responsive transcriptional repressor